jgi:hypothetical protein
LRRSDVFKDPVILLWSEGRHSGHRSILTTVVYLLFEMNNSTSPNNRPTRTGARGGSRTGHKSTHSSKSASTNGSKPPSKQASYKEQNDPSRPRFARTDLSANKHLIRQESMPDPFLSCKTSSLSNYWFGKSIPVVLHSGHDKFLKVTDNVRKLGLKSTTSRQVVSCESAEGNQNILSPEDSQPNYSAESKNDDASPAKGIHGRLKEAINVNEGSKEGGVVENKPEYPERDNNSGLAVVARQNGNSPELAHSGDCHPVQIAERQHNSRRQSDHSGYLDIYSHLPYSETASMYSGKWANLDWTDSNSGLIQDLCDIVRDGITESGLKDMECFIKPALTPMMQTLVDRIIRELCIIPIPEWTAETRQCPGRSSAAASTESAASTTNSSSVGPSSSPSARSSLVTNGKFGKHERDEELSDDDEEKLRKGPPGPDTLSNESEIGSRLACPFQKHDPKRYRPPKYGACASKGWESISRLK